MPSFSARILESPEIPASSLEWWGILLIVLASIWTISIVWYLHNVIYSKLKFLQQLDPDIAPEYKPFERYDRKNWIPFEIYFCGVVLLPIRFILAIFSLLILQSVNCLCLCEKGNTAEIEFSKWKRGWFKFWIRISMTLLLMQFGIFCVPTTHRKISEFDKNYPEKTYKGRKELASPPILIANHFGYLDSMYLLSRFAPSFVAKSAVRKIPLIGSASKSS